MLSPHVTYERFVDHDGARLRAGLVAAYGPEVGLDAAAEALAYGWEHWERLSVMANPAGYLYRVGQTAARRARRPEPMFPAPAPQELPTIEPGLPAALAGLSEVQRTCVVLVHALQWSPTEVAGLLGLSVSTVRTHVARGVAKLQTALEGSTNVR